MSDEIADGRLHPVEPARAREQEHAGAPESRSRLRQHVRLLADEMAKHRTIGLPVERPDRVGQRQPLDPALLRRARRHCGRQLPRRVRGRGRNASPRRPRARAHYPLLGGVVFWGRVEWGRSGVGVEQRRERR